MQIVFLLAFFGLVLLTRFASGGKAAAGLEWFFHFDPLILMATGLSAHAVAGAALWALAVVGLTLVAGRVFCGWICPLGTVHAVAGWLLRPRSGRTANAASTGRAGSLPSITC